MTGVQTCALPISSPDRRQVFCYITEQGRAVVEALEEEMREADEVAVGNLSDAEQKQLLKLLEGVRSGHRAKKRAAEPVGTVG